jgi:regulator of replication initiation timing
VVASERGGSRLSRESPSSASLHQSFSQHYSQDNFEEEYTEGAHVCSRMLTYTDVCQSSSQHYSQDNFEEEYTEGAHVCSRMLTYADAC